MNDTINYICKRLNSLENQSRFNCGIVILTFAAIGYKVFTEQNVKIKNLQNEIDRLKSVKGE